MAKEDTFLPGQLPIGIFDEGGKFEPKQEFIDAARAKALEEGKKYYGDATNFEIFRDSVLNLPDATINFLARGAEGTGELAAGIVSLVMKGGQLATATDPDKITQILSEPSFTKYMGAFRDKIPTPNLYESDISGIEDTEKAFGTAGYYTAPLPVVPAGVLAAGARSVAVPAGRGIAQLADDIVKSFTRGDSGFRASAGGTSKITGEFGGITTNKKGGKSFSDINKLIKNESVRSVLDKVKTGELSRAQAAKILEDSLGVTNLTAFHKGKNVFDVRGSNFSPIYDAYIKTIPQDDIFLTYPDHIFQTTGKKLQSSEIKKVGELDKIFKRVNSEEFLNIKLPDGTTMKDQPLDYQYYNAYIDSVPRQDHAAYSEFAKKYLNDFYKFRKSKEFNFRKPVKYDEVEGTGYIYDTRVGDKMSKAMSSEFKPLYDTLRKKVQSNVADIPAANQIRVGIPGVLNNHLTRMINRAELEGASFDEIAEVINNIDAKAISDLFTRKFLLENKIRALKTESLSSSLKQTDPQLFPESIPKLKEMNTGLIEISHIEDVVDNWRASFDINNLFLASGKFNRDQRKIDIRLNTILGKLDNIKPDSNEAKELLKEMANLEQSLVDKNLISKIGDRYFGVSKDTDFEKAILDKTQKAVDMTRFFNKGGIVSIEEMIQPINLKYTS